MSFVLPGFAICAEYKTLYHRFIFAIVLVFKSDCCIIIFTEIHFGELRFGECDFISLEVLVEMVFRSRTAELRILNKKFSQKGFVMTVLYGRRRVGKTKLINQFMQEHDCRRISFTART